MAGLEQLFDNMASINHWRDGESRSGPGSTLIYTVNLRSQLAVFLAASNIRSFFDAPCGDFNWMKEVYFPADCSYIGGEIARSLVALNRERYASPNREFMQFDITVDPFPDVDLWFCRDCLFHLSFDDINKALRNFCSSNVKWIMLTNHFNLVGFENKDIQSGKFRLLDLYKKPFCFPREIKFRIADYVYPHPPREMCVWTREQVAATLER